MSHSSETRSGLFLLFCTLLALALANSPLAPFYAATLGAEGFRHWVNDGLMALFFFQIGLEIKIEIKEGQLAELRRAAFPVVAALGGMIVPVLIFLGLSTNREGWAIPMATDIAFSLALLSLFQRDSKLRIFLLALAIVDDLGAILVITLFFSHAMSPIFLIAAIAILAIGFAMNRLHCERPWSYLALAVLVWLMTLNSGLHPTIGGVLAAFMVPVATARVLRHHLEHWVAWLIMPAFALTNAGLVFSSASFARLLDPLALAIAAGLVVGKPLGILTFSYVGEKFRLLKRPLQTTWFELSAIALLCGIGFTMSLFISSLAYAQDLVLLDEAKMAVLLASLIAGIAGAGLSSSLRKNKLP